jgi:hypothetical protein
VATRVFADEELERLRGFPEIGRDELARFVTLTPADACDREVALGRRGVVLDHLASTRLSAIASTLLRLARQSRCRKELNMVSPDLTTRPAGSTARQGGRLWLLLGQFMGLLDVTIVNVAVPIARRGCFSDLPLLPEAAAAAAAQPTPTVHQSGPRGNSAAQPGPVAR